MGETRDYYEVLGVGEHASEEEVRAAFRRLARERHPDRFRGTARAQAEREFQAITEAYNVLVDAAARKRYELSRRTTTRSGAMNPRDVARALVAKAIGVMKLGEHADAGELLRQAVAHDPQNARAQHLFGMYLAQHAHRLDQALRHLDQAAKLDSMNVRVLLDASRMFALARMFARAKRLAQAAAELSPSDPAVELWLQQLQEASTK